MGAHRKRKLGVKLDTILREIKIVEMYIRKRRKQEMRRD